MKTKHCPYCKKDLPRNLFTSTRAKFCNPCKRIRQLEKAQEMRERAMGRLKKKKSKTKGVIRISDLKKRVQRVVNKYIRQRDADEACISCGQVKDKYDAGHYIAQGSSGYLRYDLNNIHCQCTGCNRFKHGNLIEYRINLIKKIGVEQVEWLEYSRHKTHKWTREELLDLETAMKDLLDT